MVLSESQDDNDDVAMWPRLNQMEVLEALGFTWLCQSVASYLHLYAGRALEIASRNRGALAKPSE